MDGILVVDKPKGMTSHDVVAFLRKYFGLKKVGHAGTLDPLATGVLVVLVGKGTKSSGSFMSNDKEYEGTMTLGARSDTGDAWGRITPAGCIDHLKNEEIAAAFSKFLGNVEQTPPPYSAVKVRGRKLYEFARKGIIVKASPRTITIKEIEILRIAPPEVSFRVVCSKGTYIRQLCADIGDLLGCGAYLERLTRTRSGRFHLEDACSLDELKGMKIRELEERLIGLDRIGRPALAS